MASASHAPLCIIGDAPCLAAGRPEEDEADYYPLNPYHYPSCRSAPASNHYFVRSASAAQVEQALRFADKISENCDVCSLEPEHIERRYKQLQAAAAAIGQEAETVYAPLDAVETGIPLAIQKLIAGGLEPAAREMMASAMKELSKQHRIPGRHGPLLGINRPVGVTTIIVPFNVPAGTIIPKLFVALLAGCPVIVKPSPVAARAVTRMLLTLHRVLRECDAFPSSGVSSLLQVLQGGASVGRALVSSELVRAIQFTGSPATAQLVCRQAGLRPVLAECGGSNAIVICKGADLTLAVRYAASSMTMLSGQWCLGTSRIFVHEAIKAVFLRRLQRYLTKRVRVFFDPHASEGLCSSQRKQQQQPGAPVEEDADDASMPSSPAGSNCPAGVGLIELGCLCSAEQANRIRESIATVASTSQLDTPLLTLVDVDAIWREAVANNAVCASCCYSDTRSKQGEKLVEEEMQREKAPPAFVSPTLILEPDVALAAHIEFFAPVASLHTFNDENDAVHAVNMSPGQLGCSIFAPEAAALRLASRVRNATMTFINSHNFSHEVGEGVEQIAVTFSGSSGLGRDGNGKVLAQFFSRTTFVGVSGDQDVAGHEDEDSD